MRPWGWALLGASLGATLAVGYLVYDAFYGTRDVEARVHRQRGL